MSNEHSKLLQNIDDKVIEMAMENLAEMRKENPGYPDHELLLYLYCNLLGSNKDFE